MLRNIIKGSRIDKAGRLKAVLGTTSNFRSGGGGMLVVWKMNEGIGGKTQLRNLSQTKRLGFTHNLLLRKDEQEKNKKANEEKEKEEEEEKEEGVEKVKEKVKEKEEKIQEEKERETKEIEHESKAEQKMEKQVVKEEKMEKEKEKEKEEEEEGEGERSLSKFRERGRTVADQIKETMGLTDAKMEVPKVYPRVFVLPISKRPLFPGFYKAVVIKDPKVIAMIKELLKIGEPYVGAFMLREEEADVDHIDDVKKVYDVGVFAQITSVFPSSMQEEDSLTVVLYSHARIKIEEMTSEVEPNQEEEVEKSQQKVMKELEERGMLAGKVTRIEAKPIPKKNQVVKALASEIVSIFKEISTLNALFRDQIASFSMSQSAGNVFEDPGRLADFAAAVSSGEAKELQEILEEEEVEKRMEKAHLVLKKELMNAQLQNKISKDVEAKIAKRQREYYLMEQLKGIKRELGLESDGKDKMVEAFKGKVKDLKMPEEVKKVFDEEIQKLMHLEPAASEFNVTRNYLEWLTNIPWGKSSEENFDIAHAKKVLDEDHYGLEDVKDRILEFIAVGKLRGQVQGKVLCFVGPPGVGKTSIGKSIARSLNREFYRFSVGGLADVAEIKGHRRTYVGAMPGKVVQALKKTGSKNPLVLIDEIDKLGRGSQGDPASALLELLDPEQNGSFVDHYLDVPLDLSRVLFVCTANVIDTIPGPLLDRMELIRLSGYLSAEKEAIATQYLIPTAKKAAGLDSSNISITTDALQTLIKNYCRESGVRNLKKHIEKIYRKCALQVITQGVVVEPQPPSSSLLVSPDYSLQVGPDNLRDYVGPPMFTSDRLYSQPPIGVVMGLAWTSMGGSALYIESIVKDKVTSNNDEFKGKIVVSGKLGQVMQESANLAYTYAIVYLSQNHPQNKFFKSAGIHLHVPEGATPKDGPSAGITMTTSLLSLALNKHVRSDVAMTGELTLTGKVLKIGGLKEKIIAARRSGIKRVIFPKDNLSDWLDLPQNITDGIEGCAVDYYSEVPPLVF